MNCLIAFKTDTQAYLLPISSYALGACVITQPKYIPIKAAEGLPMLPAGHVPEEWISTCNQPDLLSSSKKQTIALLLVDGFEQARARAGVRKKHSTRLTMINYRL